MLTEGFNNAEAQDMAHNPQAGDEFLGIKFRMHPRHNKLKSDGGLVKLDKFADVANLEALEADLKASGIKYTVRDNEKDDTVEVRVTGAGRPIFDNVEYATIRIPGDKYLINDFPVNDNIKRRFARQYQTWKQTSQNVVSGTPLAEWPGIDRSTVEELANFGVGSVEQLASIPDGNASNIGPIKQLIQKAKDYLASSKGLGADTALRAELDAKDEAINALKEQMAQILAERAKEKSEEAEAPKRGPGRPRKEAHDNV